MTNSDDILVIAGLASRKFPIKSLLTNFNLDEYHTIIWSLASFEKQVTRDATQNSISQSMANAITSRLKELKEWVSEGHNLIIVLDHFNPIRIYRSNASHGTFDLSQTPLLSGIKFVRRTGERIEYIGPTSRPFAELSVNLRYDFVLESEESTPLYRVTRSAAGADQVVGLICPLGKGCLFLLPPAQAIDQDLYVNTLTRLPVEITVGVKSDLPVWANQFHSPLELNAHNTILDRTNKIGELQTEIDAAHNILKGSAWMKELFAGSGDAFVDAVSRALTEMGLAVVAGPHPRGDILIAYAKKIAVAEAKGLDGVSREANLRQTQRWVADVNSTLVASPEERAEDIHLAKYAEKLIALGVKIDDSNLADCKGIMIIGTFRKTPLDERTGDDFPNEVLRIATRDEVCCLTGLDLLLWFLWSHNNESLKNDFRNNLFSTKGRLVTPVEWRSLLSKK
jgi:hypothetical protein